MLTARVNGTDIAYTDSGGDGPAIVLSHGYLMDHTMFDPQLSVLAPEFRVITWDERGFGDTSADGPFSYWDSARDVLGLLDHLGLDRAVLGGMSQGGFLGLRAALLEPGRVPALVLIDTQAGQEDPALAPGYEQMEGIWLEQGPEPVQEVVASTSWAARPAAVVCQVGAPGPAGAPLFVPLPDGPRRHHGAPGRAPFVQR